MAWNGLVSKAKAAVAPSAEMAGTLKRDKIAL
jgi:hypothetical protein